MKTKGSVFIGGACAPGSYFVVGIHWVKPLVHALVPLIRPRLHGRKGEGKLIMIENVRDGMPVQPKQQGFTLIELMVIVALVAILASVAVPNFTQFVRNNRVTTQADEIHRFLQYARGEAVVQRRNQQVKLSGESFSVSPADRILEVSKGLEVRFKKGNSTQNNLDFEFMANGSASDAVEVLVCHEDGEAWITQKVQVNKTGRVTQAVRERKNNCQL